MLKIQSEIKPNGKPCVKISKEINGIIHNGINNTKFHCGKENLFIIEQKVNSPIIDAKRNFIVSIRRDGIKNNQGEFILSQMSFDEDELQKLRESIDSILNN